MELKDLSQFLKSSKEKIFSQPHTIGQNIECLWNTQLGMQAIKGKYVILGVPDDRGVAAKDSLTGSKEGPRAFRNVFYKLFDTEIREYNPITHHPFSPTQKKSPSPKFLSQRFLDAGDIIIADNIKDTHENLALVVEYLLKAGADTIFVIGGGHDMTYGTYKGHVASRQKEVIPIINFDAHFDLYPVENNIFHNGTQFNRILQDMPENILDGKALLQIGIQREQNPHFLYQLAEEKNIPIVEYLPLFNQWRDLQLAHTQQPLEHIQDHIDDCAEFGFNRYQGSLHLSLDLDIFNHNYAPGTSLSSPMGIQLHDISSSLVYFSKSRSCRVVDIAELCPPRDFHDQTSRLAASLVYRFALVREEYASR